MDTLTAGRRATRPRHDVVQNLRARVGQAEGMPLLADVGERRLRCVQKLRQQLLVVRFGGRLFSEQDQ